MSYSKEDTNLDFLLYLALTHTLKLPSVRAVLDSLDIFISVCHLCAWCTLLNHTTNHDNEEGDLQGFEFLSLCFFLPTIMLDLFLKNWEVGSSNKKHIMNLKRPT